MHVTMRNHARYYARYWSIHPVVFRRSLHMVLSWEAGKKVNKRRDTNLFSQNVFFIPCFLSLITLITNLTEIKHYKEAHPGRRCRNNKVEDTSAHHKGSSKKQVKHLEHLNEHDVAVCWASLYFIFNTYWILEHDVIVLCVGFAAFHLFGSWFRYVRYVVYLLQLCVGFAAFHLFGSWFKYVMLLLHGFPISIFLSSFFLFILHLPSP